MVMLQSTLFIVHMDGLNTISDMIPVLTLEVLVNMVITVPADGLAPNTAMPSTGTMLTTTFDMFSSKFLLKWRVSDNNLMC